MKEARHVCGPIALQNGCLDVSIWGAALSSAGILYLCAYNHNLIIDIDLAHIINSGADGITKPNLQIPADAPNNVTIDPKDESILYVGAGSRIQILPNFVFTNPEWGTILQLKINDARTDTSVKVVADGLPGIAGVGVVDDYVVASFQSRMMALDMKNNFSRKTIWVGDSSNNDVWLVDDIKPIDCQGKEGMFIVPAYTSCSWMKAKMLLNVSFLHSAYLFVGQLLSAWKEKENLKAALLDAEVAVNYSNTFIGPEASPCPIRLAVLKNDGSEGKHYEIDLSETRKNHPNWDVTDLEFGTGKVLGQRYFFDEQVTHAAHLKTSDDEGYIVCINFQQPRVLIMKDNAFVGEP